MVTDGMRVIGAYRLHRARHGHGPADVAARRLESLHRRSARRIYELCVAMRGGTLKVGQFLSAAIIRNIIAQVKSTINMREIMDTRKILLVNLSKGDVGEANSSLLDSVLVNPELD